MWLSAMVGKSVAFPADRIYPVACLGVVHLHELIVNRCHPCVHATPARGIHAGGEVPLELLEYDFQI